MKLNDPFGRMERRHEQEYISLSNSLKEAGVNDQDAAEQLCQRLDKRARIALLVIAPLALILMLALKSYALPIGLTALVIGVWIINTTRKAKGYIHRYVNEQLNAPAPPAEPEHHEDNGKDQ